MRLLADEGVDQLIVDNLRRAGNEVLYVAEMSPGLTDEEVLDLANRLSTLLLTADKDFGELLFRQKRISSGIILLRLAGLASATKAEITTRAIRIHASELPGSFTVITPGTIRIRKQSGE
jgi:predicted nuclease of predicted toxin-antitoxin system